jgi:protein-arginine kinase activator protein McsA
MTCNYCGKNDPTLKTRRLIDTAEGKVKMPLLCDQCFNKMHRFPSRPLRDAKFGAWLERLFEL